MLFRIIYFLFLAVPPCSQAWSAPTQQRFNDWQAAVRLYWGEGHVNDSRPRFPACTLIPVPKLALPGMLIEIDAVAALPDTRATEA